MWNDYFINLDICITDDTYYIQESAAFVIFAENHVGISEPSDIITIPRMGQLKRKGGYEGVSMVKYYCK